MKVWKIFVDLSKEELYLRAMAEKGYAFVKHSQLGFYTFAKIQPKTSNYRVDYRAFGSRSEFEDYLTLFDDAGWNHIYGKKNSGSQYFLPKPHTAQTNDIFSDPDSKAGRYKRQFSLCLSSSITMLAFVFIFWLMYQPATYSWYDPHSWYLTPGIWELTGTDFWRAFAWEAPHALMRGIGILIPLPACAISTIVNGIWAFQSYKLYRKTKDPLRQAEMNE
jgi:hypothetical protein